MKVQQLPRLIRTVRHLRWSQLGWRARRIVQHRWVAVPRPAGWRGYLRIDSNGSNGESNNFPGVPLPPHTALENRQTVELLQQGVFRHLNQSVKLGRPQPDWRLGLRTSDRLWTITLHYHRWVYELAEAIGQREENAAIAAQLLDEYLLDWIRRCDISQPGTRQLAWNSFAIATRLSWWIRACLALGKDYLHDRPELESALLSSMWRQADFLHNHLEWDLRGNHLLRNAVGLAWAGRFFHGDEPAQWLQTATELAVGQAAEQVLGDGGHFERSPMYHLQVMHELLSLVRLLKDPAAIANIRGTWREMAEHAAWLRHPDGLAAQLNDGERCPVDPALAMAGHIGAGVDAAPRAGGHYFLNTGLVVWQGMPWTVFFDVGRIGPDYQPGHAHADTLTLECSFGGQRLFVDPGCHSYDDNDLRQYDRSTQAHNTVCIDRHDSSEMWHIFRVGRRAQPRNVRVTIDPGSLTASAGHNGYDHLPGTPRHHRRLTVHDAGSLEICDSITGRGSHMVEGGLLVAPKWTARAIAGGWQLTCGTSRVWVAIAAAQTLVLGIESSPLHPAYGQEVRAKRLVWRHAGELPLEVRIHMEGS